MRKLFGKEWGRAEEGKRISLHNLEVPESCWRREIAGMQRMLENRFTGPISYRKVFFKDYEALWAWQPLHALCIPKCHRHSTEELINHEKCSIAAHLWKPWRLNYHLCERDWSMDAHPHYLKLRKGAGFLDLSSSIVWTKCSDNRVLLFRASYTQTMPFWEKVHCKVWFSPLERPSHYPASKTTSSLMTEEGDQGSFLPP